MLKAERHNTKATCSRKTEKNDEGKIIILPPLLRKFQKDTKAAKKYNMKTTEKITVPPLPTSRFCLRQHGGADRFPEAFSCC